MVVGADELVRNADHGAGAAADGRSHAPCFAHAAGRAHDHGDPARRTVLEAYGGGADQCSKGFPCFTMTAIEIEWKTRSVCRT